MRGLARNLSDLTVASSQYNILLCSETLVSDMHHVSEVLVPSFGRPVLLCQGKMPQVHGMAAYVRDGYKAFHQPKFEFGFCKMLFFRVCSVRQNLYVYSLYHNADLGCFVIVSIMHNKSSHADIAHNSVKGIGSFFIAIFHYCVYFKFVTVKLFVAISQNFTKIEQVVFEL